MSSSISSTSQPQQAFQQVSQSQLTDALSKAATSPTATSAASSTKASTASGSSSAVPEAASHRNADGTYGPGHTATAPFNPSKSTQNSSPTAEASDVGVNVKV